ncbi:MAG: hypothetical protein JKY61_06470 [Planctomycetes bacterium]|nr:hypothetical protein [Planctomycetota bacterium]
MAISFPRSRSLFPVLLLTCLLASCVGSRKGVDPTLRILGENGTELGVSTRYGVLFLGRYTNAGPVEIEAMFGDGPSIELTVIDPLGDGLYTANTNIRLPSVPMTFEDLKPGQEVLLRGRTATKSWERWVKVRGDERVHGILLDTCRELNDHPDQIGAGVFLRKGKGSHNLRLIGLVSGRITLYTDGIPKTYLTVEGPETLWRLITHKRQFPRTRKWIYREDVM